MKSILFTLLFAFSLGTFANDGSQTEIKFEKGNFFAITQQFDGVLLDNFSEKVLNYDADEMIIYFDSPGGSVIALSRMARIMKSSKIKFTCVANFAASAAFMLYEHCQKRVVLSDGVLMSHNWSGSFSGEAPRILSFYNTINGLVNQLEAVAISKMNVDEKEYARLINNNLWMTPELAMHYHAADEISDNISCSKDLIKEKSPVRVYSAFESIFGGPGSIVYKSGCPLIQKLYTKATNTDTDRYVPVGKTLFELSQKMYKSEQANWIYMGAKNF